ncbi:MAG: cytochrome c3 family protein [Pseudomonadota bacterium]
MSDHIRHGHDRSLFLPGETSYGHHQIELACEACHTESYTDKDAMQVACESCHLDQLKLAKDDHPKTKFTDPRNAARVARLDARYCVTCHVEHRPDITLAMGLTQPVDYCFICHEQIAEDRPSHAGMAFDTCASAGCHNFHDNRALYEDFLLKHLDEPVVIKTAFDKPGANLLEVAPVMGKYPTDAYPLEQRDATNIDVADKFHEDEIIDEWLMSAHSESGVTCSACHHDSQQAWLAKPDHSVCQTCHEVEVGSFLLGKHGMRLDIERLNKNLSPMSPKHARLNMLETAHSQELSCNSCHGTHRYDVEFAATDGCLACHDDNHSRSFKSSPHFVADAAPDADWQGLTCADCHMPMTEKEFFWGEVIWTYANHNQSENFLPNEKMLRPVCMQCHGLQFAIDSLADRDLIANNFNGRPTTKIQSLELARARLELAAQAKAAADKAAAEAAALETAQ